MVESLELFKSVVRSKYVQERNTSIVLFLTKFDILGRKIKYSKLKTFFPDFEGDEDDEKAAAAFFRSKFDALNHPRVKLFVHMTDATDSDQVKYLFGVLQETVLVRNLKENGCF